MSKKTAKSKGYRHYKKEKPFLTKKEIYALIAIVAVLLVAVIAFACYDDGALKIKDGAIEGIQPNWVITNGGSTTAPRYFKLAEAGEIEGYAIQPYLNYTDYRLHDVHYYPVDEADPIDQITISTASIKNSSAAEMGKSVVDTLKTIEEYTVTTDYTEAKAGDIPYGFYAFTTAAYVEPAADTVVTTEDAASETAEVAVTEDAASGTSEVAVTEDAAGETAETAEAADAPNTFGQSLNAYVETAHDGCLMIHVVNETDSAEEFLSDDELRAVLDKVITAMVIEK